MTLPWTPADCGGCPPFVHTCPGVPDRWAETTNTPPASNTSHIADGHCASDIVGSSTTLEIFASHLQPDPSPTGMGPGLVADTVALTGTWDPNAFGYSAQINGSVATDPPDPLVGRPLGWAEHMTVDFAGPGLYFGNPFSPTLPFAFFQISYHLDKLASETVDSGNFHYHMTWQLLAQHRLVTSGAITTEVSVGATIADIAFIAGRIAIDRNLARGTIQFYEPLTGWQEFPITHDLAALAGSPGMAASLQYHRDTAFLTNLVDKNTSTADLSINDLVPCVDIPTRGSTTGVPIRNQDVKYEVVGYGDGTSIVFATTFAFIASSLRVEVAGLVSDVDATDPAAHLFTLTNPAPVGAVIVASYTASGL